jgi:hypothetical protein
VKNVARRKLPPAVTNGAVFTPDKLAALRVVNHGIRLRRNEPAHA